MYMYKTAYGHILADSICSRQMQSTKMCRKHAYASRICVYIDPTWSDILVLALTVLRFLLGSLCMYAYVCIGNPLPTKHWRTNILTRGAWNWSVNQLVGFLSPTLCHVCLLIVYVCGLTMQDPPAITYPIQSGDSGMKEEILKEICQRVARRREYINMCVCKLYCPL